MRAVPSLSALRDTLPRRASLPVRAFDRGAAPRPACTGCFDNGPVRCHGALGSTLRASADAGRVPASQHGHASLLNNGRPSPPLAQLYAASPAARRAAHPLSQPSLVFAGCLAASPSAAAGAAPGACLASACFAWDAAKPYSYGFLGEVWMQGLAVLLRLGRSGGYVGEKMKCTGKSAARLTR